MTYFKVLALLLGFLNLGAVAFYFLSREKWSDFLLKQLVPEKRPSWLIPALAAGTIWVLFTWFKVVQVPRACTYVVALYVTFTVPKLLFTYFQYAHMRTLVQTLLGPAQMAMSVVMVCAAAVGAGFIAIGFYL